MGLLSVAGFESLVRRGLKSVPPDLGSAIAQLVPEQRTLLYLLFAERVPGKDVATGLAVKARDISREKKKAVQRLRAALASLDASAVPGKGYRDCLEIFTGTRNLRDLAGVFLTALTELQDVGQPFQAVGTARKGRPTDEDGSPTEAGA